MVVRRVEDFQTLMQLRLGVDRILKFRLSAVWLDERISTNQLQRVFTVSTLGERETAMNHHSHQHDRSHQLVRLQDARRALSQANSVAQITSVRAKAESVRSHAQRASLGIEIQNYAAELKLQAERLAGHFLAELKLRGGDRKSHQSQGGLRLSDLGIDKNQSARWQLAASVPEPVFRDFVRNLHGAGHEISSAKLLRLAKSLRQHSPGDDLIRSPDQLPDVGIHSHLLNFNGHSWGEAGTGMDEINEMVNEIRNHHQLLTNVVASICQQADLEPTSTDYRAIQRYLSEINLHLDALAKGLRRMGHLSCAMISPSRPLGGANCGS
jgi:hypothetical protein